MNNAIRKPSVLSWIIWAVVACFVLFQFFLQLSSGAMLDGLMKSFSVGALGGGILASAYYYIYVTLQTPAGVLIDRYGVRLLLTIGAVICSLGCFIFATAHSLTLAFVGRLLMGGGSAFGFVSLLNLIGKWFPLKRFAFMTALTETCGVMGSLIGSTFLAKLIVTSGWRFSMICAAIVALSLSILIALIVRDSPVQTAHSTLPPIVWKIEILSLLKNKIAWINGIYSGLMFAVVTVFFALWGIPFTMLAHHLNLPMATFVCNTVFIGIAIGSLLAGWLDQRIQKRRVLLFFIALATAILMLILINDISLSLPVLITLNILAGVGVGSYVISFVIANEIVSPHMRGTSIGFTNTLSVGAAPLLQPLVGFVLHMSARHSAQGLEIYSVSDYQIALFVIPLMVLVAAILACFLPEKPS